MNAVVADIHEITSNNASYTIRIYNAYVWFGHPNTQQPENHLSGNNI
jgi:hypothetical protein